MATYEVETDLIVHCKVKVTVEAGSAADAIDAAAAILPANADRGAAAKWKAKVDVTPPRGVKLQVVKAYHFEQASGADKARKVNG